MKHILVIDDLRTLTVEEEQEYGLVTYARDLEAGLLAMNVLGPSLFQEIWLDHDLGDNQDVRLVVQILERIGYYRATNTVMEEINPKTLPIIRIITSNPVGRQYIRQALEKYYEVKDD